MVDDDRVCLGEGVVGYSARVLGAALMTTLKTNEHLQDTCDEFLTREGHALWPTSPNVGAN